MLGTILSHTPGWVLLTFFLLLFLGYLQSRPRQVATQRLIIVPLIMLLLSLESIALTFKLYLPAYLAWVFGFLAICFLREKIPFRRQAVWLEEAQQFRIEGSWGPLALMLLIFVVKYFLGAASAMQLPWVQSPGFICIISLMLGSFSGLFAAGAYRVLQARRTA